MRKIILEVAWEDIIQSFIMGIIVSKYDPTHGPRGPAGAIEGIYVMSLWALLSCPGPTKTNHLSLIDLGTPSLISSFPRTQRTSGPHHKIPDHRPIRHL
jgi:hypothetical protein